MGDVLKRERFHVDGRIEWTPRKNMLFTLRPYYQERDDDGQITGVTFPPPDYMVALPERHQDRDVRHQPPGPDRFGSGVGAIIG